MYNYVREIKHTARNYNYIYIEHNDFKTKISK